MNFEKRKKLKQRVKKIIMFFNFFGIDPVKILNLIRGVPGFTADYLKIRSQFSGDGFRFKFSPILDDKYQHGGVASGHYFHQDLLVAKKIFEANPEKHVDIGSRVDGFIAHLAVFRKVTIIDIRSIDKKVPNIEFVQADMMDIKPELIESCDSLSCLHALEHFGLGRYGDPIDVDGHKKGFASLRKLLKPGGKLYLAVPIGTQRLEFNAQRVFDIDYLIKMYESDFALRSFSFVDDRGDLTADIELTDEKIAENCGCEYGCGIFELEKRTEP